jgi:hypothetical protein
MHSRRVCSRQLKEIFRYLLAPYEPSYSTRTCPPRLPVFEEEKSYHDIRGQLRTAEVPIGLGEKIIRERHAPMPASMVKSRFWPIAAAIAILAGVAGFFLRDAIQSQGTLVQSKATASLPERTTPAPPVSIRGEVLDADCYVSSNLDGPAHAACAGLHQIRLARWAEDV